MMTLTFSSFGRNILSFLGGAFADSFHSAFLCSRDFGGLPGFLLGMGGVSSFEAGRVGFPDIPPWGMSKELVDMMMSKKEMRAGI